MRTLWYYIKNLYLKMEKDNTLFLASGVAFNLLVSVIPIFLIIFSIGGFVLHSSSELWERAVSYIQNLIPVASERIIDNAESVIQDRALIGIVGLVGTAFTATRLFATLRTVLDVVFEIRTPRGIIHGKLFDFMMLLLLGLTLVTINLGLTLLPGLLKLDFLVKGRLLGIQSFLNSELIVIFGTLGITILLLFSTYKLLPSKKMDSGTCWMASIIAALFIELGKNGYAYYLSLFPEANKVYGTLGALVAMIIWFYLSALVYLAAAELAFIRERRRSTG